MTDIILRMECAREGIDLAAFQRVAKHALTSGVDRDAILPGIEAEFDAAAKKTDAEIDDAISEKIAEMRSEAWSCLNTPHDPLRGIMSCLEEFTYGWDERKDFMSDFADRVKEYAGLPAEERDHSPAQPAQQVRSFAQWMTALHGRYCVGRLTKRRIAEGYTVAISKATLANHRKAYDALFA